ncbi:MAG: hypothetical protein U5K69_16940 [Balneolaceae bacterium]|nr:hypothetical protein [Balneolaceae bacterium]
MQYASFKVIILSGLLSVVLCCAWVEPSNGKELPPLPFNPDTVKLTAEKPTDIYRLTAEMIQQAASILEIPVIGIINPDQTPFSIAVYLVWSTENTVELLKSDHSIKIGNFSLFPPDKTGTYTLRASAAFANLPVSAKQVHKDTADAGLLFHLQPIEERDVHRIEVTIAPVTWRQE